MLNDYNTLSGAEEWDGEANAGRRLDGRPRESFDTVTKRLFTEEEDRFVLKFPASWENALRPFDDVGIRLVQGSEEPTCCGSKRLVVGLSMALTSFTAIELGLSIPVLLLSLQKYDLEAITALYVMLCMAFMTQVFKRFVWRDRPFFAGRAACLAKELKTSSFPSRAVVGGVVYASFAALVMFDGPRNDGVVPWGPKSWPSWLLVVGMALSSSWARIVLGVHYPSDCFVGACLGLVIFEVGCALSRAHIFGCHCHLGGDEGGGSGDDDDDGDGSQNVLAALILVVGTLASLGTVAAMSAPPLSFWKKGTHAFSLLFSALVFVLAFRCPSLTGSTDGGGVPWGLKDASSGSYSPSIATNVVAVAFVFALSALALSTQKVKAMKKTLARKLAAFLAVTVVALIGLILLRL